MFLQFTYIEILITYNIICTEWKKNVFDRYWIDWLIDWLTDWLTGNDCVATHQNKKAIGAKNIVRQDIIQRLWKCQCNYKESCWLAASRYISTEPGGHQATTANNVIIIKLGTGCRRLSIKARPMCQVKLMAKLLRDEAPRHGIFWLTEHRY